MLIDEQRVLRQILQAELSKIQAKNPAYSQRAFARKLGLSSGTLSSILTGSRRLSPAKAQGLVKALKLDREIEAWVVPVFEGRSRKRGVEIERVLLELDRFELIADPLHLNLLNFLRTDGAKATATWLAQRTGRRAEDLAPAIERLVRCGLVRREAEKLVPTDQNIRTPENFPSQAIREFHRRTLAEATTQLEAVPVELRDFSAITIPANPEALAEVRELIKKFRDEACHLLRKGEKQKVYKLCVQVFPVGEGEEA